MLKKHARSQEEKMKKMATKLLRLTADEKKEAKRAIHPLTGENRLCIQ
jgi:mRNA-degrading endonuclease YafQ of YafQ-DinJ toxin-antitoxin module